MRESRDHFFGRLYEAERSTGPLHFLNPTNRYHLPETKATPSNEVETGKTPSKPEGRAPKVVIVWKSRDNRKGRHAVAVTPDVRDHTGGKAPRASNTWHQSLRGIARMFMRYPVWDVSYDVAVVFTIGSIIWVLNGFFAWLPVAYPSTEFSGEVDWAGGLTAFIGATVFEVGSVLLMIEAVNENRSACFGWAVEESLDGFLNLHPAHGCRHSHARRKTFIKGKSELQDQATNHGESAKATRNWSWFPTWYELRTHYFREIGFLACFSQMLGASVFWIAGLTSIAPILNSLSTPATNGVYWLPQVVGGTGFIVSSSLFMLEVQPRWYTPAPGVLGWHIGLWNLIGALGFTLCGALGFGITKPGVEYAATLATFIGSWAFLIGSAIQWYESLDKYPVQVRKNVQELTES